MKNILTFVVLLSAIGCVPYPYPPQQQPQQIQTIEKERIERIYIQDDDDCCRPHRPCGHCRRCCPPSGPSIGIEIPLGKCTKDHHCGHCDVCRSNGWISIQIPIK